MPDNQPSPEAMAAARDWIVFERECDYLEADLYRGTRHLAKFIDKYMQLKWIKCSERMPTEEDSDNWERVLWGNSYGGRKVASWRAQDANYENLYTHWMRGPSDPEPEPEDAP